jgi:hypothetical protein
MPRNMINKPGKRNVLGTVGMYRYTYRQTVTIFALKDTGIYASVSVQMYKSKPWQG